MNTSVFERLASLLTVGSICGPLGPDIPAGTSLEEVEDLLDPGDDPNLDPFDNPSPVIDAAGHTVGIFWACDHPEVFDEWLECGLDEKYGEPECYYPSSVDDLMRCPVPFLTADTSILDAIEFFDGNQDKMFYVTQENRVVGVLCYSDLFNPLGRLALLGLALEIEELALRLCRFRAVRKDCWTSLAENRREKAISEFRRQHNREPQFDEERDVRMLIECTHLADKANMIWKQKLIASHTRKEALSFFHKMKNIRDRCAHPGAEGVLLNQEELADFIRLALKMRHSLLQSIQEKGVKRVGLEVEPITI